MFGVFDVFGATGSEAEAGSLHPVEGAGAMALKAAIPEADVAGGC